MDLNFEDIQQLFMGGFNRESYTVTFNIYVGTQLVQSQSITTSRPVIEMNFTQLCQQVANSGQPMKVEMIRHDEIYDKFEQKNKQIEYKMDFKTWKDDADC